ncbi:hypothetical protein QYE76_027619 [Lolium multiflorum]|uniref:F-box domain-containing protein n=1 Tax=Lolium multiflorum TaxID=4521 RepID=A0AAD8QJF8_LOLMU|nr:hypothetical protein QYE76_027619 [Lolium multiflorum]
MESQPNRPKNSNDAPKNFAAPSTLQFDLIAQRRRRRRRVVLALLSDCLQSPAYTSGFVSAMSSAVFARRARSRSPPAPGRIDPSRRTRPRVEEEPAVARVDMASALPDDMLLEVFKRLPPPTGVVRCAAVCRSWRRVVSRAGSGTFPDPPRHLGFFRNYAPSTLPPFVHTAGVALNLGFLPKTFARLPALPIAGHLVACCAVVPGQGAEFRVVVVLFGATSPNFYVLIYSSASSAWEVAAGTLKRRLTPHQGPSVVIGDFVYRLDCEEKYIMAVNTTKMTISVLPIPDAGMLLCTGNNWIGTTEDSRLCFLAIREPLIMVRWVLEAPRKWTPQEPVALRPLMNPATVGDLHGLKLSARIADQLVHGCKLVSFGGFCESSGTLFLIMADRVVSLDLKTFRMERLWLNDDKWRPLYDVFPYEMVAWPPAIKDSIW